MVFVSFLCHGFPPEALLILQDVCQQRRLARAEKAWGVGSSSDLSGKGATQSETVHLSATGTRTHKAVVQGIPHNKSSHDILPLLGGQVGAIPESRVTGTLLSSTIPRFLPFGGILALTSEEKNFARTEVTQTSHVRDSEPFLLRRTRSKSRQIFIRAARRVFFLGLVRDKGQH
jgi:hypothetical protein